MSSLRENIKTRLKEDNINFLLVQFVDLSGTAKVKMCPVEALNALIEREASRRLAALEGTMPDLEPVRRLRVEDQ